jgi:hypothetical protein
MRVLVAFFALSCSGCATSGLAWVSAGDPSAVDDPSMGSVATTAPAMPSSVPQISAESSTSELEPPPPSPRLTRTVTLGEIELGEAREPNRGSDFSSFSAPRARGERAVTIVYVTSPGVVYDPRYHGRHSGRSSQRAHRSNQRAGVRPHASPERATTVTDYGPAFPFKAAPAAPW